MYLQNFMRLYMLLTKIEFDMTTRIKKSPLKPTRCQKKQAVDFFIGRLSFVLALQGPCEPKSNLAFVFCHSWN